MGYISDVHLGNSTQIAFGKGRALQKIFGDWINILSMAFNAGQFSLLDMVKAQHFLLVQRVTRDTQCLVFNPTLGTFFARSLLFF